MSRTPASFSFLCPVVAFALIACADDDGVGTQPEQLSTGPNQTSSPSPTGPAPGSDTQGPSSSGTAVSPSNPALMPSTPLTPSPSETAEPDVDPDPTAPSGSMDVDTGTGASADSSGNPGATGDESESSGGASGETQSSGEDETSGGVGGTNDAGMGGGTGTDGTGTDGTDTAGTDTAGEPPVTGSVMPSAACGSGGTMPNLNLQNTLISIPNNYDGSTPVPVVIAFHAAGNGNDQMRSIIGSAFENEYIMLYPKSGGNEWSNQADAAKVDAVFDALDEHACYDKNRVFAAGHSSGAQFIVQRLCAGESRWRAVSPVASSVYCSSWNPIPALVIHGIGDQEREAYGLNDGDGEKDIVPYRTSNSCSESSTPVAVEGCMSGGVNVEPGCRDFDDCTERTRWCQHTDPQYGTSHHGVPCFGARVMKEFFDMYH